jgi:hypothetical protein
MQRQACDRGIDSPGIVLAQPVLEVLGLGVALFDPRMFGVPARWQG